MPINYAETFETVTPESAEFGECEDQGFISELESCDFRDMVELLRHTEDSGSWYTYYEYNEGTTDYYETGETETRSYHPKTARDMRYMAKAYAMTHAFLL